MAIDLLSLRILQNAGVTSILEVHPSVGDSFGPWTVVTPGDGELSYWFYGGPRGIALPDGTVVEMFGDINQRFKINKYTLDKVVPQE